VRQRNINPPEFPEVRGSRFFFIGAPLHWTETRHGELHCDKCEQPLVILFAARENSGLSETNPHWWLPTAATCACLLPRSIALHEVPRKPRGPKRDARQLELLPKEAPAKHYG
jgi:hypothetical protein